MVIHFTASRKSVIKNIEIMRKIITTIHTLGHVLSRDWMEPYYITAKKKLRVPSAEEIYQLNVDAIERADLVIVEGSEQSFGSGFQLATALQKKRPTLLLIDKDCLDEESSISQGVRDPFLKREQYSSETLSFVVSAFIDENTVSTKDLRFNFVIDREIYNHLRWKSYKNKKTKAEILRELLIEDIERG